jgi:hypothetical protein
MARTEGRLYFLAPPAAERGFDDGGGGEQGFLLEGAADELDAEG